MHVEKKILLILILTGVRSVCFSQPVQIAAINKEKSYVFINRYISYLKSSSIISFDSAQRLFLQNRFSELPPQDIILKGYDPSFYWFRFIMSNHSAVDKDLVFMQGGLGARETELWQSSGSTYVSLGKSGHKYPFNKRPYRNLHYYYPVHLTAGATDTFYLFKDESHAYKVISFGLMHPDTLKKLETDFYFKFGILVGLMLLFIILNLYLYAAIKEKIHLWYCLYILFTLLFIIKDEGLDTEFLGLDSEIGYRLTSMGAIASLAIGFQLKVVQLFLVNISRINFLNKVLSFIKWSCWTGGIAFWFVFYIQPAHLTDLIVFEWTNKSMLAAFFVIPVACIYSFRMGYKPALFILAGMATLIAGATLRALFIPLKSFMIRPTYFEIGIVLEAIIISFGLMYRYNLFKKEKDTLKRELDIQKKDTTSQVLLAQEAEQKRIAADLHDELGGNLAAIKMTLQSFNLPVKQSVELTSLIDRASTNARNISHNLMPPDFADTNLKDLLENYYRQLNAETDIRFYFHFTGNNNHFDKQEELMIYRVVMELTNNILKHSKATEATVQFIYHQDNLSLVVEDNGNGFYDDSSGGIGFKNIQSRIKYLNGSLDIDSGDKGSTIMIQIPYRDSNE